ncbi:hypothetical protein [Streptomyces apocyni]|uniref:hypothetical protein n=1 Tax=Streptomyces apocyni TaxID=2654677 RepID=UPI002D806874|nr:hypothetical protein [Streptomyces apocyni]
MVELLPDAAEHRAFFAGIVETFHREGLGPAVAAFTAGNEDDAPTHQPPAPVTPLSPEAVSRMADTLPYFLNHILRQFTAYTPDIAALQAVGAAERLVPAGGRDSRGQRLYRPSVALAEQVGAKHRDFPGGHIGAAEHPAAFADMLAEALTEVRTEVRTDTPG